MSPTWKNSHNFTFFFEDVPYLAVFELMLLKNVNNLCRAQNPKQTEKSKKSINHFFGKGAGVPGLMVDIQQSITKSNKISIDGTFSLGCVEGEGVLLGSDTGQGWYSGGSDGGLPREKGNGGNK